MTTTTWPTYPEKLKFDSTREMLSFIEKHPEVLLFYRSVVPSDEERQGFLA